MGPKKNDRKTFFLTRKFLMKTPMRRDLLDKKKHDRKILILKVLISGSLCSIFLVQDALPYVCMVRCGRPTVFIRAVVQAPHDRRPCPVPYHGWK